MNLLYVHLCKLLQEIQSTLNIVSIQSQKDSRFRIQLIRRSEYCTGVNFWGVSVKPQTPKRISNIIEMRWKMGIPQKREVWI